MLTNQFKSVCGDVLKLTTYVIHLKRAEDRQANVDILCSQLPGVVKVLDAVDSLQLSTLEIESAFSQNVHRPHYPFPLRKGEIACFMSNRLAWQSLIESNDEYCLIIEDDVLLDNIEFLNALELVLGDSDADSFVRFPIKQKESVQSIIRVDNSITHFYPNVVGLGTVMQLVGRNTAKKLLNISQVIDRPIDTFLQMTWITGVYPSVVYPSGVTEISSQLGGSTIGSKNSFREMLIRELMRPIYRIKIKFHSRFYR